MQCQQKSVQNDVSSYNANALAMLEGHWQRVRTSFKDPLIVEDAHCIHQQRAALHMQDAGQQVPMLHEESACAAIVQGSLFGRLVRSGRSCSRAVAHLKELPQPHGLHNAG